MLLPPSPAVAAATFDAAVAAPLTTSRAEAEAAPTTFDAAAGLIDTGPLDDLLADLDQQYQPYLGQFSLSQAWREARQGGDGGLLAALTQLLPQLLWGELLHNSRLLSQVLILAVLSLLLTALQTGFGRAEVGELARWVVYLVLLSLVTASFFSLMQSARQAADLIGEVVFILLPLLLPLLASLGGVNTVALVSPALLFALNFLMQLMRELIFPLIWFSAILRLVSQLAPRFPVSSLAVLAKDLALGVMSVATTIFIAFLSFSGLSAASRDGLAVKAAKTASGAFIPVVGRTLADALDSVMGTVLVLKGAIGLAGGLALLVVCAAPAVQILAQALLYRVAGAVIQPLGDSSLAAALSGVGNSLILLFAALAVCGLFAFFALALVVGMGNVTMMMR